MVKDWSKNDYSKGIVGLNEMVKSSEQEEDVFYGAEWRGEKDVLTFTYL